jgi:hypothetical protein
MKTILFILFIVIFSVNAFAQKQKKSFSGRDAIIMFNNHKGDDLAVSNDTTDFRINHISYCLQNYRKEQLIGVWTGIAGAGVATIGAFSDSPETAIAGGVIALSGFVIQMRSYRWLKQAYVVPIEKGLTAGIKIKF